MSMTEVLRNRIKTSGKSLNQIEIECGLGRGGLSRFVAGGRDLTFETAARVAEHLGMTLVPSEEAHSGASVPPHLVERLRVAVDAARRLQRSLQGIEELAEAAAALATPHEVETYIEITPARRKRTE